MITADGMIRALERNAVDVAIMINCHSDRDHRGHVGNVEAPRAYDLMPSLLKKKNEAPGIPERWITLMAIAGFAVNIAFVCLIYLWRN
jgi:hypothetical protein